MMGSRVQVIMSTLINHFMLFIYSSFLIKTTENLSDENLLRFYKFKLRSGKKCVSHWCRREKSCRVTPSETTGNCPDL